ncbi:MAG: OsmC family peroxiredoxin [Spirochaetaceae bacterium]|nr:MAG: OsmC family peroxiredoxin [Spirochaetaceae bacterium]
MKDVTYTVSAEARSKTRLDVSARDFTIVVDEPKQLGGTDAGPNPLEYELASLAGCINVTGHLVAREMGLTISDLKMTLSGTLNPARFMGRGEEERAGFKEIAVVLELSGVTDAAQLEAWRAAVEERCPVSDNLNHGTEVHVSIQE